MSKRSLFTLQVVRAIASYLIWMEMLGCLEETVQQPSAHPRTPLTKYPNSLLASSHRRVSALLRGPNLSMRRVGGLIQSFLGQTAICGVQDLTQMARYALACYVHATKSFSDTLQSVVTIHAR